MTKVVRKKTTKKQDKEQAEEPLDIYYLAKIYYLSGEFLQCEELLESLCRTSLWAKLLAAQCLIELQKWNEVVELLGSNQFQSQKALDVRLSNSQGRAIKIESSLCHLRGVALLNLGNKSESKESFIMALKIDPHCFQALDALSSNYLLTPGDEKVILDLLMFDKLPGIESEFIKSLYISKLAKFVPTNELEDTHKRLEDRFNLSSSPLIIMGKVEYLVLQRDFEKAYSILKQALKINQFQKDYITGYIICLYALEKKLELFTLSNQLIKRFPNDRLAWFAVGTYYLFCRDFIEARRHFSKATSIDDRYAQGWIAFGHSFALENEFDSAISVYSSSCKVIPNTHYPKMYLGIMHAKLRDWKLAKEYLLAAETHHQEDGMLWNELGCVFYEQEEFVEAIRCFHKVLDILEKNGTDVRLWAESLNNLGHAYRKSNNYIQAKMYFNMVGEISSDDIRESTAFGLALIAYNEKDLDFAIDQLHKALRINDQNKFAAELLDDILNEMASGKIRTLPVLNVEWIDKELLDKELEKKVGKIAEIENIRQYQQESFNEIEEEKNLSNSNDMMFTRTTRSQFRNRLSTADNNLSPDIFGDFNDKPRKGLLNFESVSPKTPPRLRRRLFENRDTPEDNVTTSRVFSLNSFSQVNDDIFGDSVEMDLDSSESG